MSYLKWPTLPLGEKSCETCARLLLHDQEPDE